MNISEINKALVVGLGYRTGLMASNFLSGKGVDVTVSDIRTSGELMDTVAKLSPGVKHILGHQSPEILKSGFDCLILSPGVPKSIPLIKEAERRGIPVISEIELAHMIMKGNIISVTGTDGKTTTTSLVGHILKELGLNVFVGGNIGTPLISFAEKTDEESVIVAELSSFQLETIRDYRPHVASILNVTPDHLDRYDSMESYFEAKMRIAMNQKGEDYFVYNKDDGMIRDGLKPVKSRRLSFSLDDIRADIFFNNGFLFLNMNVNKLKVLDTSKLQILGVHNIQNSMAALLMVFSLLEKKWIKPDYEKIATACYSFPPLQHRMEKIGEYMGRIFINDSKATTIGAVEMALRSIKGRGVLILGGRTKGDDYSRLDPAMKDKVRALVLVGESRDSFSGIFGAYRQLQADSLDDAAAKAMSLSDEGDVIILSPACASFDMFKSYEERGMVFKEAFRKLSAGEINWT